MSEFLPMLTLCWSAVAVAGPPGLTVIPKPTEVRGMWASALSPDGRTVAGTVSLDPDLRYGAFVWSADGGYIALDVTDEAYWPVVMGVSNTGIPVGLCYIQSPSRESSAIWWPEVGPEVPLPFVSGTHNAAFGISGDGKIIVGALGDGYETTGFAWTRETGPLTVKFNDLDSFRVTWISDDGVQVGGSVWVDDEIRAFRRGKDGRGSLIPLPADAERPSYWIWTDFAGDGTAAIVIDNGNSQPFIWRDGIGSELIDLEPASESISFGGVTPRGELFGYSFCQLANPICGAFAWTVEGGFQLLEELIEGTYHVDLGGLRIQHVSDMSADGRILLVSAYDSDGNFCGGSCKIIIDLGSPCSTADLAPPFYELDFYDAIAFLEAYAAGEADFNDDGVVNFFDVAAFLTEFATGCS